MKGINSLRLVVQNEIYQYHWIETITINQLPNWHMACLCSSSKESFISIAIAGTGCCSALAIKFKFKNKIVNKFKEISNMYLTCTPPPSGLACSSSLPESESLNELQYSRICSSSLSTLASRLPRLSSGWEWTMLWSAWLALRRVSREGRLFSVMPSLSSPCNNSIRRGRQPTIIQFRISHISYHLVHFWKDLPKTSEDVWQSITGLPHCNATVDRTRHI